MKIRVWILTVLAAAGFLVGCSYEADVVVVNHTSSELGGNIDGYAFSLVPGESAHRNLEFGGFDFVSTVRISYWGPCCLDSDNTEVIGEGEYVFRVDSNSGVLRIRNASSTDLIVGMDGDVTGAGEVVFGPYHWDVPIAAGEVQDREIESGCFGLELRADGSAPLRAGVAVASCETTEVWLHELDSPQPYEVMRGRRCY